MCSLKHTHARTHARTHLFNGPFTGTTRVGQYQKVKLIWILLKQETVSGGDISWAICKYTPRTRQITTPAPHHSRGNVTSVGWQVTLYDLVWHISSRSGVAD